MSRLTIRLSQAHAELLLTMRLTIENAVLNPEDLVIQRFRHGLSTREVEDQHKRFVREGRFAKQWVEYGNKLRALVNYDKKAERHKVHGTVHFYPLVSDDAGLIDHSRCLDCALKTK